MTSILTLLGGNTSVISRHMRIWQEDLRALEQKKSAAADSALAAEILARTGQVQKPNADLASVRNRR